MKKIKLGTQILIGIALGLLIGFISPKAASVISPLGDIFLNLLKMLIVPLVFFSITNGVIMMQDAKQLRSVGGRIILFYVVSSLVAAVFGTVARPHLTRLDACYRLRQHPHRGSRQGGRIQLHQECGLLVPHQYC